MYAIFEVMDAQIRIHLHARKPESNAFKCLISDQLKVKTSVETIDLLYKCALLLSIIFSINMFYYYYYKCTLLEFVHPFAHNFDPAPPTAVGGA